MRILTKHKIITMCDIAKILKILFKNSKFIFLKKTKEISNQVESLETKISLHTQINQTSNIN